MFYRKSFLAVAGAAALGLSVGTTSVFAQTVPTFARVNNGRAVYYNNQGTYQWVPNPTIFFALGGQWNMVRNVSQLPGTVGKPITVIRLQNHKAVYAIQGSTLHWIPSPAVFYSLGYNWGEVVSVQRLPFPIGTPESGYPNLSTEVPSTPATTTQVEADLNSLNPEALGLLKLTSADATLIAQAWSSPTAPQNIQYAYDELFITAFCAENPSVFVSPLAAGTPPYQNIIGVPTDISRIDAIKPLNTQQWVASEETYFDVTYTTTSGVVRTDKFGVTNGYFGMNPSQWVNGVVLDVTTEG